MAKKEEPLNLHSGRTIRTLSGRYIDVFDPKPEMFNINDIAHALSNLCRWGGHVPRFYSVAQHSCICSSVADPEHALAALLHDASEAYLVDVPRPIKREIQQYVDIETNLLKAIFEWQGLDFPLDPQIKEIDDNVLKFEHDKLILGNGGLTCMSPDLAKYEFLKMYKKLTNGK